MSLKKINVTARDIARGIPGDTDSCPIARAAKRVIPEFESISSDAINVGPKQIFLPGNARRFIENFDYGERVKPFQFTVDI